MTQEFVTLPRAVVEHVMYHLKRGDADAVCWADGVIKPELEKPQRKLTPQDIADSALLGNIESPLNACMHQEHCKRWKEWAEQHAVDHQRESSSGNDLPSENGQLITSSSTVPTGWKLVPVEPTEKMIDIGRSQSSFPDGVYRKMLAAAPQPPTTEQSSAVEQPQVEQKPVAWISPSALEWSTRESEKVVKLTRKAQPEYDFTEPLYTQPQPPRQPLTNEEIDAIAETMPGGLDGFLKGWGWRQFARAIEAAHNIK